MTKPRSSLKTVLKRSERSNKESGQIMPMAAFLIIPLLIMAAFAVDLGSFYHRASQLQSASDLASLAGADLKSQGATESEVRDVVDEVLADNGIDTTKVNVSVNFSGDEVQVVLDDNDVPVYLASLFMDKAEITRDATAVKGTCAVDCDQPIIINPPMGAFPTQGDGDGTVPKFVTADNGKEYVFTLKHHQPSNQENAITGWTQVPQLLCVDVELLAFCPGFPRRVNTSTSDITQIVWSEATNEIWYAIQRPNYPNAVADPVARRVGATTYLGLGCVNLDTLNDCGSMDLTTVPHGPPIIQVRQDNGHMRTEPHLKDGKIYVIDHNMTVHCKDTVTRANCTGYPVTPGGYWSTLRATDIVGNAHGTDPPLTDPDAPSWFKEGGYQPSMLISGDNRLYGSWPTSSGSYSFCFDLDTGVQNVCSGFASSKLIGWPGAFGPGVFEDSDGAGNPDGFCAIAWSHDLACVRANGGVRDRSAMNSWLPADLKDRSWSGAPYRFGSKVFIGAPDEMLAPQIKNGSSASDSKTYCYDLVANTPCAGGNLGSGIRQDPQPYGYDQLGTRNCLISLGHVGKFTTFAPDTLDPCPSGDGLIEVFPCGCGDGTYFWGEVSFEPAFLANFSSFEVTVEDGAGNELIGVTDLVAEGGRLDLSGEDTTLSSIFIKYTSDISPGVIQNGPIAGTFSLTERAALID